MKQMPQSVRLKELCTSSPERAPRELCLYGSIFSGKKKKKKICTREHFNQLERLQTFLQTFLIWTRCQTRWSGKSKTGSCHRRIRIKADYDADNCSDWCPHSKAWPLSRTHILSKNTTYRDSWGQQQNDLAMVVQSWDGWHLGTALWASPVHRGRDQITENPFLTISPVSLWLALG